MIVSSSFSSGIWNDITFLISCTRIFSFISNKLAKIFKFAIDKPCACLIYDFLFLFCRNLSADTAPPCGVCRKIYTSFFLDAPTPQYQKNNIFPLEKCKCCTFCGMSDDIGHRSAAACWEWDTGVLRWWWGGVPAAVISHRGHTRAEAERFRHKPREGFTVLHPPP